MPNDNYSRAVEFVEAFMTAFASADWTVIRTKVSPECVVEQSESLPYAGSYQGVDGFIDICQRFNAAWNLSSFSVRDIFVDGGGTKIVLMIHVTGTSANSGVNFDTTIAELWELTDGKISLVKPHWFQPPV